MNTSDPGKILDIQKLLESITIILQEFSKYVHATGTLNWQPSDGFLGVLYRSILSKQHDALAAIVELVEHEHGHAAVSLLRPSCEEYIWVKYLRNISEDQGERLIIALVGTEISENLQRQEAFSGRKSMLQLGFTSKLLGATKETHKSSRDSLRTLGQELNWPERNRKDGTIPSMGYFSRQTQTTNIYNFLYHATSRSVHFSVVEIMRRSWGHSGRIEVSSATFRRYWSAFALTWGHYLYRNTLAELAALLPSFEEVDLADVFSDEEQFMAANQLMKEVGLTPIITSEELFSSSS